VSDGTPDPTDAGAARPMQVDAGGLKALAHPLRVQMYDLLSDEGPATASQLGEKVGESSGTTSYHLRLLARHGFIEEDRDRGNRRDKYWRVRPGGFNLDVRNFAGDPALEADVQVLTGELWRSYARSLERWFRSAVRWGEPWVGASVSNSTRIEATPEEMAAIRDDVVAVIERHVERLRAREIPHDAARIFAQFHIYPVEPLDDGS
jgi:DNA-binding transcriptional ArsR family regulator